MRENTTI